GLRGLRDVGRAGERPLLRRPVPLAVLLAVPGRQLPARDPAPGRLVVEPLTGLPHPVGARRIPRDLLLLPQGVLPVVLRLTAGVRGARLAPALPRRDAVSVRAPEHPPVLLLALAARAGLPVVGRRPRLRLRGPRRHGPRHPRPAGQRRAAVAVLLLVS